MDGLAVGLLVVVVALVAVVMYLWQRLTQVSAGRDEKAERVNQDRVDLERDRKRLADDEQRFEDERTQVREQRRALEQREDRMAAREDRLQADRNALDEQRQRLEDDHKRLAAERLGVQHDQLAVHQRMMRIAGLTAEQAQQRLMDMVEHETRLKAANLARDIEQEAIANAEQRARRVVVMAIQRIAAEQTAESVVALVNLPSDDMKGRIIGREGRNIRSFEQVTGVDLMIDDTPGSVLVSSFDPVRREVARATLAELVSDGRIYPARIEEAFGRQQKKTEERMRREAHDALAEVGISDIHDGLIPILGSLAFRASYGQNVLRHLVECGKLAGIMAAEIGANPESCIRAAFLHDIGKAMTHEIDGSHALVGAEIAERHGESPEIVHAIAAHHNEIEPSTIEAILTQAADAISGSRPGARRESFEAYVKRLEDLERIAGSYPGVDRVFAMQAGRDVRVMVSPREVDDEHAHLLARDIARQIEQELTYPGQIHITVIRESRASEIAR